MPLMLDDWVEDTATTLLRVGGRFATEELEIRALMAGELDDAGRARILASAHRIGAYINIQLAALREACRSAFGEPAREPTADDLAALQGLDRTSKYLYAISENNRWLWNHAAKAGVVESSEPAVSVRKEVFDLRTSIRRALTQIGHGWKPQPENQARFDAAMRGEYEGPFLTAAEAIEHAREGRA